MNGTIISFIKKHWHLGVLIGITALSFLYPGYSVLTSDQRIYIPQVLNRTDSVLQNTDLLYSFNQTQFTFFDELLLFLTETIGVDLFLLMLMSTVIIRFIYFFSIFKIAQYFTGDRLFSVFSPIIFLAGLRIFGTATSTLDLELHPRGMSLAFSLLFLAHLLEGRKNTSPFLLGFGILLHPITAIPFVVFYYADMIFFFDGDASKEVFPRQHPICFFLFVYPIFIHRR